MGMYICKNHNITAIDMCSFRNCSQFNITYNLTFLLLDNNIIIELHDDIFMSLTNIIAIDLHNNRITSISYMLFINNKYLQILNLTNNKIKIFIVELAHLSYLSILDLRGNPIETFHEGTLKRFFTSRYKSRLIIKPYMGLGIINNIKCDCNVHWIQRIKGEIKFKRFYLENELLNVTSFLIL